jgi:signal-transduction protein with cAMP-binding, CBS, and nucleotidyltransferase domain
MLVKDVMSKNPRLVMPETSIAEAVSLMQFYHCDGLPVAVDKEFIGFVQLRDVLAMLSAEKLSGMKHDTEYDLKRMQNSFAPLLRATVKQVMGDKKRSVSMQAPVDEAMSIMMNQQISRLAVTEDNKLVGMVSFDDIDKAVLAAAGTKVTA